MTISVRVSVRVRVTFALQSVSKWRARVILHVDLLRLDLAAAVDLDIAERCLTLTVVRTVIRTVTLSDPNSGKC